MTSFASSMLRTTPQRARPAETGLGRPASVVR